MASEATIKGTKELIEFLSNLPLKLEKNILRSALRAGAGVIAKEAKAKVPVGMGNLKKSIRTGSNVRKGGVEAYVRAGGRKNKSKDKDQSAFYAQFVEFGTAYHPIKPKNKKALKFKAKDGSTRLASQVLHPGAKAQPFMRPAYDAKSEQAMYAVSNRIRQRLTKAGLNAPDTKGDDDVS